METAVRLLCGWRAAISIWAPTPAHQASVPARHKGGEGFTIRREVT